MNYLTKSILGTITLFVGIGFLINVSNNPEQVGRYLATIITAGFGLWLGYYFFCNNKLIHHKERISKEIE